jgi:hypothetical protein
MDIPENVKSLKEERSHTQLASDVISLRKHNVFLSNYSNKREKENEKLMHIIETLGHTALIDEEYLRDTGFYDEVNSTSRNVKKGKTE